MNRVMAMALNRGDRACACSRASVRACAIAIASTRSSA
jgi:hypothetical protein